MRLWTMSSGTRRAVTGLGVLVLAGALASACGGSSSSGTTTTSPPTTSAGSSTTSPSTTATTAAGSGLSGTAFLGRYQSGQHATFIATYKITSSATHKLTTLTIAQQSPNSVFSGVSGPDTFEFLTIGTKSYLCSHAVNKWICLNGGKSNPEAALFDLYQPGKYLPYVQAAVNKAGAHATYSTKTVNGFQLSCVSVTGAPHENGTGTFCVTSQGVLGYVSYTGTSPSQNGSFEITSYSTTVPASEFVLPAKPIAIP